MTRRLFTEAETLRTIGEYQIRKQLCQAEQDGHRLVINQLKQLEKLLGLRQTKCHNLERISVPNINRIYLDTQDEIAWRKDQIEILEMDRLAAHNLIKYHSKKIGEFFGDSRKTAEPAKADVVTHQL